MDRMQIEDLVGKVIAQRANRSEYTALLDELRRYAANLEEDRTKMTFQLPEQLRIAIGQRAIEQGISDSELVRRGIEMYLGNEAAAALSEMRRLFGADWQAGVKQFEEVVRDV